MTETGRWQDMVGNEPWHCGELHTTIIIGFILQSGLFF